MTMNIRRILLAVSFGALTAVPSIAQDQRAIEERKVAERKVVQKLVEVQQKLTEQQSRAAQEALQKLQASRGLITGKTSMFGVTPRGFSVVLVVGDLQVAGNIPDNVPEAARKALADMRDFLPYRSYALTDAAWITGSGDMVSRLRGQGEQLYSVNLKSLPRPGGLRMEVGLEEAGSGQVRPSPLINTTFDMAIGETVVVGTSRLNGDKALILLVTPVASTASK
jgi:hypothetical protein